MREDLYKKLIALQAERGRARARRRLTDLMCSGKRMDEAIAICAAEDVSLGIHALDVATEERGYTTADPNGAYCRESKP